ncbi:DUF3306 domain-containing protein [Ramlibacter sp. G-1-2-2]|uniref:DUF3306 domain-containing protein n=1 Tax=Ramlibacter agri TaxID=2728837 RepID=A0A848H2V8_9BURK|nr:DUF3306 domain-containing protein [Ramlibacter agri]NML43849.1 DUF3306 domain-containing protein [Ramlibacter agri]
MSDDFLNRWSRRKEAVRKGEEVAEPTQEVPAPVAAAPVPAIEPVPPPPTLEDTHSLTPESDFTRFVRPDVAPEVRNAALKKLFADPHFNVQDGLDVYIGDYNKPDPLPPEMLKQLAGAQFLKLFEEDKEKPAPGADEAVAQSGLCSDVPTSEADGHPDLRLQQDHAPGPAGPGQGTE